MALFIIDVDGTILYGNSHNLIITAICADEKKCAHSEIRTNPLLKWNLIKDLPIIGGASKWNEVFKTLIADGHHIALASFSAFGNETFPLLLKNIIGLSDDDLKKIVIYSVFPGSDVANADKNNHISAIIDHYQFQGPHEDVILIDDNFDKNCKNAKAKGYSVIHAKPDGLFLQTIILASESKRQSKVNDMAHPNTIRL